MSRVASARYSALDFLLRGEQQKEADGGRCSVNGNSPSTVHSPPSTSLMPASAAATIAPGGGQVPRTVSAAPADSLDDLVRTRPEKHGGAIFVEELVSIRTPRKAPQAEADCEEKLLTKQILLEKFRRFESRPLHLGRLCFVWIENKPDRAQALKCLKADLVADDQVGAATRVNSYLAIYWVARLLGWEDAQDLRVAAIRELRRLIARNAATEEWQLRTVCEPAARGLWARMVAERLPAAVVRSEVRKIRPSRALKIGGRSGKLAKLLKDIRRYPEQDLEAIVRACQDRLACIRPQETAVA